ncbi:MAG: hypothetical protein ACPGVB_04590, partial [Chitinophagales bacterium]
MLLVYFLGCCWISDTLYAQCAADEVEIEIEFFSDFFGGEMGWELVNTDNNSVADFDCPGDLFGGNGAGQTATVSVCLPEGTYAFNAFDSFGDGWGNTAGLCDDGTATLNVVSGPDNGDVVGQACPAGIDVAQATISCGNQNIDDANGVVSFAVNSDLTISVIGCTDPIAVNFNPNAEIDGGNCIFAADNDECIDATALTLEVGTCATPFLSNNFGATNSTGFPLPGCGGYTTPQEPDIWYSITVPASGDVGVTLTTAGGPTDMAMAAYSGVCGNLTLMTCDDDDGVGLMPSIGLTDLTPGDEIFILIWEFGGNGFGQFNIFAWEPPVGASCNNAVVIPQIPFTENNGAFPGAGTNECFADIYGSTLCGITSASQEKVYEFTPNTDVDVEVLITDIGNVGYNLFVFEDCPDLGNCEASFTAT